MCMLNRKGSSLQASDWRTAMIMWDPPVSSFVMYVIEYLLFLR